MIQKCLELQPEQEKEWRRAHLPSAAKTTPPNPPTHSTVGEGFFFFFTKQMCNRQLSPLSGRITDTTANGY